MPNYPNISEIASVSNPLVRGLIDAVISETPALNHFYATSLEGDRILTLGIVALPTGGFLNLGEGYTSGHTDTALAEYNAARIGGAVEVQESPMKKFNQAKNASVQGGSVPDYWSLQAMGRFRGQMLTLEHQIFKGLSYDAKGFPGLKALTPFVTGNTLTLTDTAQDTGWAKSVLNVAGTAVGKASSIYTVRYGELDAALNIGGPGGMANFLNYPPPERVWKNFTDPVDGLTKMDWFWVAAAEGYIGLSVMGGNEANASRKYPQWSVRRAANVTDDAGKGCTDEVLEKLEAAFPPGHFPSVHFMSYRSRDQLQKARTTNFQFNVEGAPPSGGFAHQAPIPTASRSGVPIVCTQVIGNTDALES